MSPGLIIIPGQAGGSSAEADGPAGNAALTAPLFRLDHRSSGLLSDLRRAGFEALELGAGGDFGPARLGLEQVAGLRRELTGRELRVAVVSWAGAAGARERSRRRAAVDELQAWGERARELGAGGLVLRPQIADESELSEAWRRVLDTLHDAAGGLTGLDLSIEPGCGPADALRSWADSRQVLNQAPDGFGLTVDQDFAAAVGGQGSPETWRLIRVTGNIDQDGAVGLADAAGARGLAGAAEQATLGVGLTPDALRDRADLGGLARQVLGLRGGA